MSRAALPASTLLALWILFSCAPPAQAPHYDDLLLGGELTLAGEAAVPVEVHCPDTTHLGLPLPAGARLDASLNAAEGARLHLEVCVPEDGGGEGTLSLELQGAQGERATGEVHLDVSRGDSQTAVLDLPAGRVQLTVVSDVAALIKNLYVESAVAIGKPSSEARRVLLVSVDTLREDAVLSPGQGYAVPNLTRFASQAQIFSPHYAGATWTLPSQATILTGQYPKVHGLVERKRVLRPGVRTLAQRFREKGFRTEALVYDCLWLDPRFGFDRGFDGYRSVAWDLSKMVREASNFLVDHRDDSFFYFLHLFEVHSDRYKIPYESPGMTEEAIAARFSVEDYGCRNDLCASRLLHQIDRGRVPMLDGESEILEHLYRRGVVETDRQLGLLFDNLRSAGLFDRMTIVVTSDHGESFEGPGRLMHGGPFEEVLRVPLLVKWPGNVRGGERTEGATSAVDVAATLAESYGLDGEGLAGKSLLAPRPEGAIFAGTHDHIVVRRGWKAVFPLRGKPRLFDLGRDPQERRNLARRQPERLKELKKLLRRRLRAESKQVAEIKRRGEEEGERGFSREEIERLESLGYVGNDG